ncbi:hypothetical protein [Rhodococcus sp. BS-15]|uniref:hypothetical protein n=1 Tax=Rhodococcus sp. BS-15 TaxID=1304954 RepID=UPI001F209D14|nr:hypothetical protein [Rhodococcus sp. BS-15]
MGGRHRRPSEIDGDDDVVSGAGLDAVERRAVILSTLFRIVGTPIVAVAGLVSAGLVIRATGPSAYGVVALVATVGLLLPFADLGIGAVVTSATARSRDPINDAYALAVIRRAYRILARVTVVVAGVAVVVMMFDGWGA